MPCNYLQMAKLRMLYIMPLPYIFKFRKFLINFSLYLFIPISQTATGSRKIPMNLQFGVRSTIQIYLFFPTFCFLFRFLRVEYKTRTDSFLANSPTNTRFVWGLWLRYSRPMKSVMHEWRLPHNLFSISRWKTRHMEIQKKTLNISDITQPTCIKFSPKWSCCIWSANSCNMWH